MQSLGRFTLLVSGERFYPEHPDKSPYTLNDLATGLSRQCRFNGMFPLYEDDIYSVAQHSVLVDDIVNLLFGVQRARPWAIAHDAPEGIIGDIITPVKAYCPEFYTIENALAADMNQRFSVPVDDSIRDIVHKADMMACAMEAEELSGYPAHMWPLPPVTVTMRQMYPDFRCWRPKEAKERFQERFLELVGDH